MQVNADFSQRAAVSADADLWLHSPESGVDRWMLDRIGGEVARATSIVRFAQQSSFPGHMHQKGEEFLVLDGVLSDENGAYPSGTYVRNPPGSRHVPFSDGGCRMFVKLRQFEPDDLQPVIIGTTDELDWQPDARTGGQETVLHKFRYERVSMLRVNSGHHMTMNVGPGGLEWLLVKGSVHFESQDYPAESWFRFPPGDKFEMRADEDSVIWQKTGHLPLD